MEKLKGRLNLIKGVDFKVGDQVVAYYPQFGRALMYILFDKINNEEWEARDGSVINIKDLYVFTVFTKDGIGLKTYPLKYKQWLACLEGKTSVGDELEFEVIKQDNKEYARIITKRPNYTSDDILTAYNMGRLDSIRNIISSNRKILEKIKLLP